MLHVLWLIIKILLSIIGIVLALALLLILLILFVPIRYRFEGKYKLLQKGAVGRASWLGPVLRLDTKYNANGGSYRLKLFGFTIATGKTAEKEQDESEHEEVERNFE